VVRGVKSNSLAVELDSFGIILGREVGVCLSFESGCLKSATLFFYLSSLLYSRLPLCVGVW
jgi:hypothetical protein